jgi:SAM-dependent methyltransferase
MIRGDGWANHCIWEHSTTVRELYRRRCRKEEPEMTAHAQAAEILAGIAGPGETLLDAGCGSGYFFHSVASRNLELEYYGIDAAPSLIAIGTEELPRFGLPAGRLTTLRLEDLDGEVDHAVCINVLSNIDNYHRPLERLLSMARRSVILRESLKAGAEYSWVKDQFLDPGIDLSVHINHYDVDDLTKFIAARGFRPRVVQDRRSGGQPELVIGIPHHWTFIVAERIN